MEPKPRILGLDVGSKTIGLAVSDPLGITTQGLNTIRRKNKRHDFEQLQRVIEQFEISEIVVGLPLRMSGMEGTQSEKMRAFAVEVERRFSLPVHLWDERLTTREAAYFGPVEKPGRERRGKRPAADTDAIAATIILQAFLDSLHQDRFGPDR